MTEEADNIINFVKNDNKKLLLNVTQERVSYCFHTFEIDMKMRTVNCMQCKSEFDSFEALCHIARNWKIYHSQEKELNKEIKEKRELIDQLKKEIISLKSKIKRIAYER